MHEAAPVQVDVVGTHLPPVPHWLSAVQRHALSAALAMPVVHAQIGWGSLVVWVAPGHLPLEVVHDEVNLLSVQA